MNESGSAIVTNQDESSEQSEAQQSLQAGDTRLRASDGMVEVYIPGGTFQMGSNDGERNEQPVHTVSLSPYWIDLTEVTNAQYAGCVAAGVCDTPNNTRSYSRSSYYGNSQYADYPVVNVDWNDASTYCQWAGGRLPTEAEWEFAARGTDGRTWPWGNTSPSCSLVNYWEGTSDCVGDTSAVGSYPAGASPFGVLDMAGNVWEWVHDWYGYYPDGSVTDPQGPSSGEHRVLRGGDWLSYKGGIRSAFRWIVSADWNGSNGFGFRCSHSTPVESHSD